MRSMRSTSLLLEIHNISPNPNGISFNFTSQELMFFLPQTMLISMVGFLGEIYDCDEFVYKASGIDIYERTWRSKLF